MAASDAQRQQRYRERRNNGTFIEIMQVAIDAARLHNVHGDF